MNSISGDNGEVTERRSLTSLGANMPSLKTIKIFFFSFFFSPSSQGFMVLSEIPNSIPRVFAEL